MSFHRYPVNSVVKHHTYTSSNIFKLCAQETGGGFTDGPTVEFSAWPYASAFCELNGSSFRKKAEKKDALKASCQKSKKCST